MLEVYELSDSKWLLLDVFREDAQAAAAPFAELTFSLDLLWTLAPRSSERTRPRAAAMKKKRKRR
jgi:hypothetical protein